MSDDFDLTLRRLRPQIPAASDRALQEALERIRGRPATERQRVVSRRGALIAVLAMVALGAAFAVGLVVAPSSSGTTGSVSLRSIHTDYGLSLTLPSGWSGRIYNEQPAGSPIAANLQAGNFPLPAEDDDVGTSAAKVMHPDSVLLILWEALGTGGGFHYQKLSGPPQLAPQDSTVPLEGFPPDHALARIFFETAGRKFELIAEFGQSRLTPALLDEANGVLKTLAITPR
jgi:hypothetical protein